MGLHPDRRRRCGDVVLPVFPGRHVGHLLAGQPPGLYGYIRRRLDGGRPARFCVFPAGDAGVAVPPWLVEFIPKKGPDGQVLWYELKVSTFQLVRVIPASSGTTARFRLSEKAPPFSKKIWIFLQEFASLEAREHIKKVCLQHQPRPNAASMPAAAVWEVDPNPMTDQHTWIRACKKTGKAG